MTGHMVFQVTATELTRGWHVKVSAGESGECEVTCPDIGLALECTLPFMEVLCAPDPLEAAFGLDSAADGPRDMGGGS